MTEDRRRTLTPDLQEDWRGAFGKILAGWGGAACRNSAGEGSCASSGGDPPGTQHLRPGQQSENGEIQTDSQPLFWASEAVLFEAVWHRAYCAEGVGWATPETVHCYVEVQETAEKADEKKSKPSTTPLLACAQEEDCAGRMFISDIQEFRLGQCPNFFCGKITPC